MMEDWRLTTPERWLEWRRICNKVRIEHGVRPEPEDPASIAKMMESSNRFRNGNSSTDPPQ